MTTGRLCQPFHSTSNQSYAASVLESPSIGDADELNETLIPSWDDADESILKIFDDNDTACSRHEDESDNWIDDERDDGSSGDEKKGITTAEPHAPWLRNITPSLSNRIPVFSSDDSDEDESSDDNDNFSGDGGDSNVENRQVFHPKLWRSKSDSLCRFSMPKYIVEKSKTSALASASLKAAKTDISKAVLSQTPGEVLIRAHLLRRHHLSEILDVVRRFAYPTHRLVIEEVHQGADVEALLIYLFEATQANGSDALRSVRYTGSWISPTLISYLASSESKIEEIELGLSLYPKARSNGRRSARVPVRNVARLLQRVEELEEALAANTSLRLLILLPSCHIKITEGLLWAASCHGRLESITVSLPVRSPISTVDVHEGGILAFEGIAEVIRQSPNLRNLSIRVDAKICRSHKDTHEPIEAKKEWEEFGKALCYSDSLTNLRIEFDNSLGETPVEMLNDMGMGLMQGFAGNSSLEILEVDNAPSDVAMDLFYGVHTRERPLQKVTLRQSPEIVSSLICIEDDEDREKGWWVISSLHVDQASLTLDLYGLEILAYAGGLRELVVMDSMSKKNAERLTQVLGKHNKVVSLVMGHDNPLLLGSLQSNSLQSLELRNGRHYVSTEMVSSLLHACPALRRLQLTGVHVDGDWSAVWERIDTHRLESLEINERSG